MCCKHACEVSMSRPIMELRLTSFHSPLLMALTASPRWSLVFRQATSFVLDTQKCDDRLALYLRSHPPELMLWMQELPNLMNWLIGIDIPILSKSYQTAKEE